MSVHASEISSIIKDKIAKSDVDVDVSEVGRVLSVGDGIARIYGLDKVQANEMVEFESDKGEGVQLFRSEGSGYHSAEKRARTDADRP